ncbi:TolB family protein [Streptomyces sp. NPDC059037]|uniref:TolB family protein n=1 Tax=Streptomyces sp. NPDC059037 TaxID=3346710 RepID=UPI0036B045B0
MTVRKQRLTAALLIATTLIAGCAYTGWKIASARSAEGAHQLDLQRPGTLLYVDRSTSRVRQVRAEKPAKVLGTGPKCLRAYAAAGTLACLRPASLPGGFEVGVYDEALKEQKVIPVWGKPSRVRVSPSGRMVAWTVFRAGDSYLSPGGYSTTAGAYDLKTGAHYGSLEDFTAYVDGRRFHASDRNFWGITFASDDRTFYATMSSGKRTWLMRGNLGARSLKSIRTNVECPSLSPDGRRIAYKKRVGSHWRLHVLDLSTGKDVPLAEPAHVDDQPAWLDARTVGYARSVDGQPVLFGVPANGTGSPTRIRGGSSPAALN